MDPLTYGDLYIQLQQFNEDYSSDFQQTLPFIIRKGELRLLRDTDLDNLDYSLATAAINQTTGVVTKPTGLIRERVATLVNDTPQSLAVLVKRTPDFVNEYLIGMAARGLPAGPPKYFAEYSQTQWQCAPLPDQAYTLSVRGIYPVPLLGDNDEDNAPAAIAALQNPTANTALTLTESPWLPATGDPAVQVSLTSTGNMSANEFTVAGLDADGNALTVVIAGPNADFVTTSEYFSQVTSITPSATDNANQVSAGYYSNNTTWLSTRFPDVLFNSCLIDACEYLKRFSAMQLAQNEYNASLLDMIQQTRNLQRSDLDDLFAARQLLNGPPAQPATAPAMGMMGPQPTPPSQ